MVALVLNGLLLVLSVLFCFTDIAIYMSVPILTNFLSILHFRLNKIPKDAEAQPANALKVSAIMFNIILFLIAMALGLSFLDPKHPSPYAAIGAPLYGLIAVIFLVSSYNLYRLFQKNG